MRTTNNMLGDCYAAAVVEELSRKELMALDAAILYQVMQSALMPKYTEKQCQKYITNGEKW